MKADDWSVEGSRINSIGEMLSTISRRPAARSSSVNPLQTVGTIMGASVGDAIGAAVGAGVGSGVGARSETVGLDDEEIVGD